MLRQRSIAFLLLAFVAIGFEAPAQSYPSKPIRLIVAFPPGGGIDTTARVLAKKLAEHTGQQVVVDNRAGAGGIIGSELVAKSAPDGYTLFMASSSHVLTPSIYPRLPFDPVKDFTAITLVARSPSVLVVHLSVPAKSVKELIALAKANPGKLNFSSAGSGSSHLAGERFKMMAGVDLLHVPYKGTAPAVVALLGGEVDLMFGNLASVLAHVKAAKLRALGVASLKRNAIMPDVPTIAEAGVPGFEAGAWYGVLAPAGLSRELVDTLHRMIVRAVEAPDVKEILHRDGYEAVGNRPDEFGAYIPAEIKKWAAVIKGAGVKAR
jgi:tripartite-type tricarboxylate transporter receptor subunit TctC